MSVTYRNKDTHDTTTVAERSIRLDHMPDRWELVSEDSGEDAAVERARAERAAMLAAHKDRTGEDIDESTLGPLVVNAAHRRAEGHNPTQGVADPERPGVADTQHRGTRWNHVPREQMEREHAEQLAHPPVTGVLARSNDDQRSGATALNLEPAAGGEQGDGEGQGDGTAATPEPAGDGQGDEDGQDGDDPAHAELTPHPVEQAGPGDEHPDAEAGKRPAKADKVDVWRAYVVSHELATASEAADLNKTELQERVARADAGA